LAAPSHISVFPSPPPPFPHVLLCHLFTACTKERVAPGRDLDLSPAHQNIPRCALQVLWAGFYSEEFKVLRPSRSLAKPSRSLWLQQCRPGLWCALQNKPAAEFVYSLALYPSDVKAETTGVR